MINTQYNVFFSISESQRGFDDSEDDSSDEESDDDYQMEDDNSHIDDNFQPSALESIEIEHFSNNKGMNSNLKSLNDPNDGISTFLEDSYKVLHVNNDKKEKSDQNFIENINKLEDNLLIQNHETDSFVQKVLFSHNNSVKNIYSDNLVQNLTIKPNPSQELVDVSNLKVDYDKFGVKSTHIQQQRVNTYNNDRSEIKSMANCSTKRVKSNISRKKSSSKVNFKNKIKKCSFRTCTNNSADNEDVNFFRFNPTNTSSWLEACQNDRLRTLKRATLFCEYYVCEFHFHRNDFTILMNPYTLRLSRFAVPRELTGAYQPSVS